MVNDSMSEDFDSASNVVEDIGDLKPSEFKGLDLSEFVGKKFPIEKVYRKFVKSKFGPNNTTLAPGQEILAPVLMVETAPVTSIQDREGNDIPIHASEMFSLKEEIDENGKKQYTWSQDDRGSLNKLLKKLKVDHPSKLKGKIVQIITRGTEEKQFLGFIKE